MLENINLPALTNEEDLECEGIISETELLKALKSMKNDKSPGNDGITNEFYDFFRHDISSVYLPETSKLIEKKDKDKRLIKNWCPISLLNIDTKLISKVIAIRLNKILNNLHIKLSEIK